MAWAICSKKSVICLNGLCYPLEQLGLSVVIHLNKIVICSNCYVNLFKKEIVDCSSNWSYLLEDKF